MRHVLPALLALCIFSAPALAQTAARSTRSGVYGRDQALRGQDVFLAMCKSCHTPESHTADAFTAKWHGKPLSELWQYLREQMPKNEPGSLSADEYADVLAYVLKLNRMPSGEAELPADATQLKSIRIDIRPIAVRKDQ
jgi:S-disulfanyl-L-cysteine oxidoreductase SoxD